MERQTFFRSDYMGLSISSLIREQQQFITDQLQQVAHSLHPSVIEDEELIRRALFAVRNKSVIFDRYQPASAILYATVQDVRPTEIKIHFQENHIECSCPQTGWCRHKVSVLLSMYQYFGSVQEWTANWRSKKSVNLHLLASERTPENWLMMVNEVMSHLFPKEQKIETYLISSTIENGISKLKKHMPFEREWQPIFKLFIELAILNKLWQHLFSSKQPLKNDYFEYFYDRKFEELQQIIQEISSTSRLFATDPFFDMIQQLVRELLLERSQHIEKRFQIYLLFWDTIFVEKKRAEEELHILEHFLQDFNSNFKSSIDVPLTTVLNVFFIILKDYQALSKNLKAINIEHLNLYFELAKFSSSKNDPIAKNIILKALLPLLNEYINTYLSPQKRQMDVRRISTLYEQIPLTEQEELMLYSAFGIYGIQPYSNYLLKMQRFEEWAALHHLYPSSISYLEICGLKEVLEQAPEVTLPLFHFYAMEEVNQKSRINYKQAVRIWKMMKSASKKCGKTNYWADYIQSIREQFKRLRALQEELEKGNLLA